jgi:TolB-like protein/Tfp pilus assembly protein PilF
VTKGFFKELRRRRVFRAGALYIIGAWVVLQVADLAFPGLGIPENAIRFVWAGAIALLPAALLLGWRFDIAKGRLVRTPPAGQDDLRGIGRADYVLLTATGLFAVLTTAFLSVEILATRAPLDASPAPSEITPKTIAVLPFTNLSGEASNEPFTLGIHDDLLTHISRISGIRVISRTSVMRLEPGMGVRDIGRTLGVANVLEGGLQRIGDRIRINVQLIDTLDDRHLWAETFDRELTTQNVFDIQTEIASAITDRLRATLSPRDEASLGRQPTENLAAYEAYLLGRQKTATRNRGDLFEARDYFQKAIALDPDYAVALVGLADANLLLQNYGFIPTDDALAQALPALERALTLDDELGAAWASMGLGRTAQRDYAGAEAFFRRAIELDPNNAKAYHWYGDMLMLYLGKPGEAASLLEKARMLDPLSPTITITLGEALEALGQFDEALTLYQKALEIEPGYPNAYHLIGFQYRAIRARLDEAVVQFRHELAMEPARDPAHLALTYLDLGDAETAEYWIQRGLQRNPTGVNPILAEAMLHCYRGDDESALLAAEKLLKVSPANNTALVVMVAFGRFEEALKHFTPLYPGLSCEGDPRVSRATLFPAINLSLAYERAGRDECAARLLDGALAVIRQMPRLGQRGYGIADVEIYARLGQTRLALDTLRQAIDEGFRMAWWSQGEISPHMASLRDEPEFIGMMNEIRAAMADQLERLRKRESADELPRVPDLPLD